MPQIAPKAGPPVVAVVDDDPAVCSSLKFSLELEGFEVRTYGSGNDLLCSNDIDSCNCFVIDQKMPGMTGLELIGRLRDGHHWAPAVLIVSQTSPAVRARAATARVPIAEKPFFGSALFDRIREACQTP